MDNQTKSNDFKNTDTANPTLKPLTDFLQNKQLTKTLEKITADNAAGAAESLLKDDFLYSRCGLKQDDSLVTDPSKVAISDADNNKLGVVLKALRQIEQQITTVINLLEGGKTTEFLKNAVSASELAILNTSLASDDLAILKPIDGRVVEGVFDGRGMVGADGKNYLVPPNYSSKSKLVEGDLLKLTITPKGSFIFKQIGPIDRSRLIGSLGYDQTIGEFYATSDNRRWSILKASVTYFKGEPGDEIVLLVPKNAPSHWAAVENIIKRNPLV